MDSFKKVIFLPEPHNIEFKYTGNIIFDINYISYTKRIQVMLKMWLNSKEESNREDGPAIFWTHGGVLWWVRYDNFHHEDGPAIVRASKHSEWYLCGVNYATEKEFNKEVARRNAHRLKNGL